MTDPLATIQKSDAFDVLAPDGSEIRLLCQLAGGSVVHCALPRGGVSLPVTHRSVEEIWFFLSGTGEVWRRLGDREDFSNARPGLSLTIPLGTNFQFRNTGTEALEFVIVTMPPWPGEDEAINVDGPWPSG